MNFAEIGNLGVVHYKEADVAAFFRSRERYGKLSNMTGGFPLECGQFCFQGPEGLYQALKFPGDVAKQASIALAKSGMDAKKLAYLDKSGWDEDWWNSVRVEAMAFTLATKLLQHPESYGAALQETTGRAIVEKSYKDSFWGAKPFQDVQGDVLQGRNILGRLQILLRHYLMEQNDARLAVQKYASHSQQVEFHVNGASRSFADLAYSEF